MKMRKKNNANTKLSTLYFLLSTQGLTLIEVMVVVAILAVISSTLFAVFQSGLFSQRKGTNKALVYSEARAALEMMSREIAKAFIDEREGLGFELWNGNSPYRSYNVVSADEFYFYAPINANNSSTGTGDYKGDLCEVGYWLQGNGPVFQNTLMRHYTTASTNFNLRDNGNGDSDALIGNVSDLQFKYWGWDALAGRYTFLAPNLPIPSYVLPRAIKIILVMQYEQEKDEVKQDTFITIVNIPGSGQ